MWIWFHLLRRHLGQYPGRTLAAWGVLAFAAVWMLALAGAGAAVRFRVGGYLGKLFPEQQLRLEAGRGSIGPIAIEGRPIDESVVSELRARPEVTAVWPVEPIRFPVTIEGNLFGEEIASEAVIHGLPSELVEAELEDAASVWKTPSQADGEYPLIASRYFLDLYNLGLARSSGLPLLSPKYVIGRHATLHLGESLVGLGTDGSEPREIRCRIVALSNQPWLLGLALPADAVRSFNAEFVPESAPYYVMVVVHLKAGTAREGFIADASARWGLQLTGGDMLGARAISVIRWAGWGLTVLAGVVFLLGLLLFYSLFGMIFHQRRLDMIRLQALGLTPRQTAALALGEVGIIALAAVIPAALLNGVMANWLSGRVADWSNTLNSLPGDLLQPTSGWLIFGSLSILTATLLPALYLLRGLTRVEPAGVIRDM